MNRKNLAIAVLMFLFSCLYSQAGKYDNSYNYMRGMEAFNKEDMNEAFKYFSEELKEHPDNAQAYYRMAIVYGNNDQWGMALTNINHAIEYDDHSDNELTSGIYYVSGKINARLDDNEKAAVAFTEAIKYATNKVSLLHELGEFYYNIKQFNQCIANFQTVLSIDPNDANAYSWIGASYLYLDQYDKALLNLDKAISLDPSYSTAYSFRGTVLYKEGKYKDAIDDYVKAIKVDTTGNNDMSVEGICAVADSAYDMTIGTLKELIANEPNKSIWAVTLGTCYYNQLKIRDAAKCYEKAYKMDANELYAYWAANCFVETGNYKKALRLYNSITDPSYENNILIGKSQIYLYTNQKDSALYCVDKVISAQPENIYGYAYRGFIYRSIKDYKNACEDEEIAISFNPDDRSLWMVHGRTLASLGRNEEAKALWEKKIKLDTLENDEYTAYTHCMLGNYDKAETLCKKALEKNPNFRNYYDAAEIYGLMGKKEQALTHLEKACELGYRNFYATDYSPYLETIKDMAQYKAIIKKYKAILQQEIEEDGE